MSEIREITETSTPAPAASRGCDHCHDFTSAANGENGSHGSDKASAPLSITRISHHIPTALSGLFTAAAFISGHLEGTPGFVPTILYIAAIIAGGAPIAPKALASLRKLNFDMNLLMCIAIIGAAATGNLEEGAMVVFLFSVAEWLEDYTIDRARNAVRSLMALAPDTARVIRDGREISIAVAEIVPGDTVIIRPGEKIPIDGAVISGSSHIDQSPITGESIPVEKNAGDSVFAGTLNGSGALDITATKIYSDTTLARITRMIGDAGAKKARAERFVDTFARYYTPAVLIAATLVATVPPLAMGLDFSDWLYRALVLLVIACPCAFVISTPVAIVAALSTAARNGVLIKGGLHLESLRRLTVIAFDKTGTLTTGHPKVTAITTFDGISEHTLLSIAASLESRSEHHIAKAILAAASERDVTFRQPSGFESLSGLGVAAAIDGRLYFAGSHRLMHQRGTCTGGAHEAIAAAENTGHTIITIGSQTSVLGYIAVADELRPGAADAIRNIRNSGVGKIAMLTGDNGATAARVAGSLGIEDVRAGLMPEDKIAAVRGLAAGKEYVAMVGDGINDAPAMAAADIGIAMGGSATDTALETADIALMADDLSKIPFAISLSHATTSVIRQNIIMAIGIKMIFLAAAAGGAATLWMAVFADTGTALIVVANSLRLMKRSSGRNDLTVCRISGI